MEHMMAKATEVEQELLKILRFGGLDKDNLASLVKVVASFADKGLGHFKVFPKGIPPVYEGLEIRTVAPAGELDRILGLVLAAEQTSSVIVFPYGIPVYDTAELRVALGPTPIVTGPAGPAEAAG
jgi:hypothetical protein